VTSGAPGPVYDDKVVICHTGSSARKLRGGGVDLLGGRARTRYLHPLTYAELGKDYDLQRAADRGLLPSIYFSDDPRADLEAYAGLYLQQEIGRAAASRERRRLAHVRHRAQRRIENVAPAAIVVAQRAVEERVSQRCADQSAEVTSGRHAGAKTRHAEAERGRARGIVGAPEDLATDETEEQPEPPRCW
jgi:hypothetical protein